MRVGLCWAWADLDFSLRWRLGPGAPFGCRQLSSVLVRLGRLGRLWYTGIQESVGPLVRKFACLFSQSVKYVCLTLVFIRLVVDLSAEET